MNNYANTNLDIHQRIFKFIIRVFTLLKKIPKSAENMAIIGQLGKSLTSIGANDQEADAAQSKKDFIAKYAIVKKETKETLYWMKIVFELRLLTVTDLTMWQKEMIECEEILKIVSSIIISAKKRLN